MAIDNGCSYVDYELREELLINRKNICLSNGRFKYYNSC